jgi:hypothetical protein
VLSFPGKNFLTWEQFINVGCDGIDKIAFFKIPYRLKINSVKGCYDFSFTDLTYIVFFYMLLEDIQFNSFFDQAVSDFTLWFTFHFFVKFDEVNLVSMQHLWKFENGLLDIWVMIVLDSDFIGMKTITIVISRNKAAIKLIENEDKATYLSLTKSQLHLWKHLPEIIWFNIIFIREIGNSKNRLRCNSYFADTLYKKIYDCCLSLKSIHLQLSLLSFFSRFIL